MLCHNHAAATCAVVIRPVDPSKGVIMLAEVAIQRLVQDPVQDNLSRAMPLPAKDIVISLSTTYNWVGRNVTAGKCYDQDISTICHSDGPSAGKPPVLRLNYPCAYFVYDVYVTNRPDCCKAAIMDFKMEFLNYDNTYMFNSFVFTTTNDRYIIQPQTFTGAAPDC